MKETRFIVDVFKIEHVGTHTFEVTAESREEAESILQEVLSECKKQLEHKHGVRFDLEQDWSQVCETEIPEDEPKGVITHTCFDLNDYE